MAASTHRNLQEIPTGAVNWPAIHNANMALLELGRTWRLTAAEALTRAQGFYVSTLGEALKASTASRVDGLWQSTATSSAVEGFGQIDGYIQDTAWTYNVGKYFYMDSSGDLTSVINDGQRPVGFSVSSIQMEVNPLYTSTNIIHGNKNTTDNVTTVLITKSLTTAKAYLLSAEIIGKQRDSTNIAGYKIDAVAQRTSDSTALLMNSTVTYLFESSAAWNAVLASTGNNIVINITGVAGSTIDWRAKLEFLET